MNSITHIGVVDDEVVAVDSLVFQLRKYAPNADIRGFTDPTSFKAWCQSVRPNLVFLDIEMPKQSGLELGKEIKGFADNIIFATAYSEYTLEAFEASAVDYLLKPITPDRLERALSKVSNLKPVVLHASETLRIPTKNGFSNVDVRDISYLRGKRNYTEVVLTSGESYLVARTLKSFMEELQDSFLRVHKSVSINATQLERVLWSAKPEVQLKGGIVVEASKVRLNEMGYYA